MTRPYSSEAQRRKVAAYAQAFAVATTGQYPDTSSILSSGDVTYNTTDLLASYNAKVADANVTSPSPAATTAASTAVLSSAQAMSQQRPQQQQQQQASPTWGIHPSRTS